MGERIDGGTSAGKWLRGAAYGLAATFALLAFAATGALAQPVTPSSFDVSAQPLTVALPLFGRQAGLQISVDGDLVRDLRTSGVTGTMTIEAALQQLLAGTGLTYRFTAADSVTLERIVVQPESGPVRLGPVTVSARRTEELLQDVPGSVVVLSAEELERSNLQDTAEVSLRLPNVSFIDNSDPADLDLSIRGISNLSGAASSPTNGVFSDGILLNPTGDTSGINANLVDLERVEVAYGPQGTAFGRGTIGGAVNFVTNKPTDEFEASLETELGSYPDGRATAIVNAPLLEDGLLSGRLVAFGGISDGFVDFAEGSDPDSVGRDDVGARLSLRSRPTSRLTLDASVSFDRTEFDASNSVAFPSVEEEDLVTTADFIDENSLDRILSSFQWTYDFDVGSLKSTSSLFLTDLDTSDDTDFAALEFTTDTTSLNERALAQEFRFESDSFDLPSESGEIAVNLGTSLSFNERDFSTITDPGADAFRIIGESLGVGPLADDGSVIGESSNRDVFNFGLFGDVRWRPIPDLEIAGGARFSFDRVKQEGETLSTGFSALTVPSVPFDSGEANFTSITPSASIKYDWTDDFSTYFAFATGFRPGGFSSGRFGFSSFEEETVRSYEGGFRASLFDDRLLVNGSGYLLDYEDIQVSLAGTVGGLPVVVVDNAAEARSIGAEIGISALPIESLRIDTQIGINFSKFTDYTDSPFGDLTDRRLPNAPVHTFSIAGDYEHPREILPGVRGFLRAEYSLRSSFNDDFDPDAAGFDGFDLLNLRLGLRAERFVFEAFVENALDETYATGSSARVASSFGGARIVDVGPSRRFGLRARLQF
ncbi:TonB-dependent receptor domain-containing protein [Algihabitans albus]|uniref:TonB-dependent receptor domain-containing protein n=1 Tax=Algihabitans albus TaxID=2164067 RepID=UPI000E5D1FCA|nr:TonB-dependent receptor [Algihabitans albus]